MPVTTVGFGPFVLDLETGALTREGRLVPVGQRGSALLAALAMAPGALKTKAELIEAAWPGLAIEESNLSVQIAALRKHLGPAPGGGEWIETVPRLGYRFLDAPVPDGAARPSVAVLPFRSLGGAADDAYFADGVVEDIIAALSRFRSVVVVARNASFAYRGRQTDIRQVASELGVGYVLEGSIRRAGDRLRISAELADGASGKHLWARSFDGELSEVFAFQDRIAEAVAVVVEPHVQAAEIDRARLERPNSVAAYDIYLRALAHLHSDTEPDNVAAWGLLQQGLVGEPNNPLLLGLATHAIEHRNSMGWPPFGPDDRERCVALARRALQYAAGDASVMAHCGLALIQTGRDYEWGMAAIQSALAANPNNLTVVVRAGIAHLHCGSLEQALDLLHRAIRLSPGEPGAHIPYCGIAHVEMVRGNHAEALSWAARALALNPSFDPSLWILTAANAHLGRMAEADRFLARLRAAAPDISIARIRAGQPDKDPRRVAAILDGLRLAGLKEA